MEIDNLNTEQINELYNQKAKEAQEEERKAKEEETKKWQWEIPKGQRTSFDKPLPLNRKTIAQEEEEKEEKIETPLKVKQEVIKVKALQQTLDGNQIKITEFANLLEKRKLKEKVLQEFHGQRFRSIITPREIDRNIRGNKLDRMKRKGDRSPESIRERATMFSKKDILTLSTFPSVITQAYTILLSKKGDRVYDPFTGHNSRAEDVLSLGRKYFGYDIHSFPIEFTRKAIERFPQENWELTQASSENIKYENESMDFALTCPPYADVEKYNKIYQETKEEDLSSKDYEDFLTIYKRCISETYRVLKPNTYFVIVVGDMHKFGKFIQISRDTKQIAEEIGFMVHDENIYNRKSNIGGDLNYNQFILKSKRFPTIHEYIIVLKKEAKE